MKKITMPVLVGLILLISLACGAPTAAHPTATKAAAAPTQVAPAQDTDTPFPVIVIPSATPPQKATARPLPTATLPPPPTAARSSAGQIVFVSCKGRTSLGIAVYCEIDIMNADGSQRRQLTNLDNDNFPALSPDGSQVAFTSLRRDRDNEIYVINSDGSGLKRLTTNPGDDVNPSWSADGSQIVYVSAPFATGAHRNIYIMAADGANPHPLTNYTDRNAYSPHLSPDGKLILFGTIENHVPALNIMNADGSNAHVVNTGTSTQIDPAGWSPDGSAIALIRCQTADGRGEIDLIGKDGGSLHSISDGYYVVGGLSWSPDGKQLVFSMDGDGKSYKGLSHLFFVNADGSNLHEMEAPCADCSQADWGH